MIENVIERWHRYLRGELPGDSTSYSPTTSCSTHRIVHTPQRGKDVTKRYLTAAGATLFGSDKVNDSAGRGTFRYTKQVAADDRAVLEFETTGHGKYVNGVDIIRVNNAGEIVEFRVMIRPLQAVNTVHEQMRSALEAMQ
jgi:hypothetical protein